MSGAAAAKPGAPASARRGPGMAFWLVGGAVLAFGLFLLALAFPPPPSLLSGDAGGGHALSRSPVGYAGVVRLLEASGVSVRIAREAPATDDALGLIVLTPGITTSDADLTPLMRGRRALVVPPKWLTIPDPAQPRHMLRTGETLESEFLATATAALGASKASATVTVRMAPVLSAVDDQPVALAPAAIAPIDRLRTLSGTGLQPVIVDARGQALVVRAADKEVYLLTDPDLLDNHGIADLRTAREAVALLTVLSQGQPVVWDVTLNGLGAKPPPKSPLKALFLPPFLPATLCLFAAAGLTGFAARGRFGALAQAGRAYGFGKRALADSAASMFALAGREPALAPRYADLAREAAAAAASLPPHASREEGDAALDRIGATRGVGGWSDTAAAAQGVTTVRGLLTAARRAYDWRRGMTGGRG